MNRRVPFSERPGRHERHFRRRMNRRFPRPITQFGDDDLLEVQRLDHEELLAFLDSLRALVGKVANLPPTEETQVILDLKAELEKHYETACGLADAQGVNKEAIRTLIDVIMKTIRRNAQGDTLAERELAEEAQARAHHFELLKSPLVANLLHPDTLIQPDELAVVLLTDPIDQVRPALELFDAPQLQAILADLDTLFATQGPPDAAEAERLALLRAALAERNP